MGCMSCMLQRRAVIRREYRVFVSSRLVSSLVAMDILYRRHTVLQPLAFYNNFFGSLLLQDRGSSGTMVAPRCVLFDAQNGERAPNTQKLSTGWSAPRWSENTTREIYGVAVGQTNTTGTGTQGPHNCTQQCQRGKQ